MAAKHCAWCWPQRHRLQIDDPSVSPGRRPFSLRRPLPRNSLVHVNEPAVGRFCVILATRNRAQSAVRAVRSILANQMPFELTVIDQSDDALTGEALTRFAGDRRMTVLKSRLVGLSRARN